MKQNIEARSKRLPLYETWEKWEKVFFKLFFPTFMVGAPIMSVFDPHDFFSFM